MQPDTGALLANLVDEAPPREFVMAMRGYDRHQVDEHIGQIQAEVRQHREQARAMPRELSEARRQFRERERPAYTGLGARIEQLLRLAEEQAAEVVRTARSEAGEITATAKASAAELRPAPRTMLPNWARTPSARPANNRPPPSARPTRSGLPPGARPAS